MFVISDFPPYVIDQIVGVQDTSYVVIKLWLCGNLNLNDKLSKGLTYLDLKCHQLGYCRFPRLISQLVSLRHLTIRSWGNLAQSPYDWPHIMRSLPNTLESLAITSYDFEHSIWNSEDVEYIPDFKHETTYTRGKSHAIEFETLFPRLHTLKLNRPTRTGLSSSELIPALPASLTHLEAPLMLRYSKSGSDNKNGSDGNDSKQSPSICHLSRLPPNITHLGPISWRWEGTAGFDAMRRDFANAPPSLQTLVFDSSLLWEDDTGDKTTFCECWLPKSLTKVNWPLYNSPPWTPTLARTMPSQLHTLRMGNVDLASFDNTHTNWVADLPRSLTSLFVAPLNDLVAYPPNDFTKYGRFLPPHLTDLTLYNSEGFSSGMFGDWSVISGDNYWPSTLKSLKLEHFWIESNAVVNLPKTLETLVLSVSTSVTPEAGPRAVFHARTLPPNLTSLNLSWTSQMALNLGLTNFTSLQSLTLKFEAEQSAGLPTTHLFDRLPKSLTSLNLLNVGIRAPIEGQSLSDLELPNLTSLEAAWLYSIDLFKHLPRGIRTLDMGLLRDVTIAESPLLADGQLFKDLPPTLTMLSIDFDLDEVESIPVQSLNHLPFLKHLNIATTPSMPSSILRSLPRSLTHLQLNVTEWNEDDLSYILPQLHVCYLENITPTVVKYMSLRSLACLDLNEVSSEVWDIAQTRVRQASEVQ